MKKYIYSVYDLISSKESNKLVAAGTNPKLNTYDRSFFDVFVNKTVTVENPDGTSVVATVLSVEVTNSLSDRKNIFFTFSGEEGAEIKKNAQVFGDW